MAGGHLGACGSVWAEHFQPTEELHGVAEAAHVR
jgi:hypothetical protein